MRASSPAWGPNRRTPARRRSGALPHARRLVAAALENGWHPGVLEGGRPVLLKGPLRPGAVTWARDGARSFPVVVDGGPHARAPSSDLGNLELTHPLPAGSFRITSPYGLRTAPAGAYKGQRHKHNGIDFAATVGTPVYAAAAGVVVQLWRAGEGKGTVNGNAIMLAHADTRITGTAYLHLSEILVHVGELVRTGQLIGRVGATGQATGPHLHFIVYALGKDTDPAPLLRAPSDVPERARPRLELATLPWWVWAGAAGLALAAVGGAATLATDRAPPRSLPTRSLVLNPRRAPARSPARRRP